MPPKPKPWPYETWQWNNWWWYIDRTSLRFDENSKLIIVEGLEGLGKEEFAKELADELDMLYLPGANHDSWYIDCEGADLRDFNDLLMPRIKCFDEKDFARNPVGPVEGSCDRYRVRRYMLKYVNHIAAIRHIFNTGQGVVTCGSPFSDKVYFGAAYNAGWIDRTSRVDYLKYLDHSLFKLMRPNLIVYLDAPVDVVQNKIKERGNEWDKNSPVWSNRQYLTSIQTDFKRNFLQSEQDKCHVLMYDWSEPGDTEVVVEDIERLNFDWFDMWDKQQQDWRLPNEEHYGRRRYDVTCYSAYQEMIGCFNTDYYDCDQLIHTPEEVQNLDNVLYWMYGYQFSPGFNPGIDKNIWLKWGSHWSSCLKRCPLFWMEVDRTRPLSNFRGWKTSRPDDPGVYTQLKNMY